MKTDFKDSDHWDKLAAELMPYRLPEWDVAPTVALMREWLKRLEIRESIYEESFQTSVEDWMALNQDWPLRSFVGLLLEFKQFLMLPTEPKTDEVPA